MWSSPRSPPSPGRSAPGHWSATPPSSAAPARRCAQEHRRPSDCWRGSTPSGRHSRRTPSRSPTAGSGSATATSPRPMRWLPRPCREPLLRQMHLRTPPDRRPVSGTNSSSPAVDAPPHRENLAMIRLASTVALFCAALCALAPAAVAAPEERGMLRLAHLSPDTPAGDVYVASVSDPDVRRTFLGGTYGMVSEYQDRKSVV